MCAGTLYWANIGALVYGLEETRLLALTGASQENPTMHLSSRTVLGSGQKQIAIHRPSDGGGDLSPRISVFGGARAGELRQFLEACEAAPQGLPGSGSSRHCAPPRFCYQ